MDGAVIDGRELAQSLMQLAFQLLVPYAGPCPACTDALFAALANDAVNEELQDQDEDGAPHGSYYVVDGDPAAKEATFAAHLERTKRRTWELVEHGEGNREILIPHMHNRASDPV